MAPNEKTVYFVEDDRNLIGQATPELLAAGYRVEEVDIQQANNVGYWRNLGVTERDVVALDLNLKEAGVKYSGREVFRTLQRAKSQQTGDFPLERVLIQTSIRGEANSKSVNPEFALANEFAVGGYEKAVSAGGVVNTQAYASGLVEAVDRLYKEENLLNV